MDRRKLQVLQALPYRILSTCALCTHSMFGTHGEWGTCGLHDYEHGKHTGGKRQLSINRSGTCPSFQMDEKDFVALEGFRELF